jgi:hypothetical protein
MRQRVAAQAIETKRQAEAGPSFLARLAGCRAGLDEDLTEDPWRSPVKRTAHANQNDKLQSPLS